MRTVIKTINPPDIWKINHSYFTILSISNIVMIVIALSTIIIVLVSIHKIQTTDNQIIVQNSSAVLPLSITTIITSVIALIGGFVCIWKYYLIFGFKQSSPIILNEITTGIALLLIIGGIIEIFYFKPSCQNDNFAFNKKLGKCTEICQKGSGTILNETTGLCTSGCFTDDDCPESDRCIISIDGKPGYCCKYPACSAEGQSLKCCATCYDTGSGTTSCCPPDRQTSDGECCEAGLEKDDDGCYVLCGETKIHVKDIDSKKCMQIYGDAETLQDMQKANPSNSYYDNSKNILFIVVPTAACEVSPDDIYVPSPVRNFYPAWDSSTAPSLDYCIQGEDYVWTDSDSCPDGNKPKNVLVNLTPENVNNINKLFQASDNKLLGFYCGHDGGIAPLRIKSSSYTSCETSAGLNNCMQNLTTNTINCSYNMDTKQCTQLLIPDLSAPSNDKSPLNLDKFCYTSIQKGKDNSYTVKDEGCTSYSQLPSSSSNGISSFKNNCDSFQPSNECPFDNTDGSYTCQIDTNKNGEIHTNVQVPDGYCILQDGGFSCAQVQDPEKYKAAGYVSCSVDPSNCSSLPDPTPVYTYNGECFSKGYYWGDKDYCSSLDKILNKPGVQQELICQNPTAAIILTNIRGSHRVGKDPIYCPSEAENYRVYGTVVDAYCCDKLQILDNLDAAGLTFDELAGGQYMPQDTKDKVKAFLDKYGVPQKSEGGLFDTTMGIPIDKACQMDVWDSDNCVGKDRCWTAMVQKLQEANRRNFGI